MVAEAQRSRAPIQRMADQVSALVRAGGDRWSPCSPSPSGRSRRRAALALRTGRRGRGADHRLSLRARPRHADVDHGRRRQGRAAWRADQECRGARALRRRSTPWWSTRPAPSPKGKPALVAIVTADGFDEAELLGLAAVARARQRAPARRRPSSPAAESAGPRRSQPEGFASITGKGVVGPVGGRRVALGNPALLEAEGVGLGEALETSGRRASRRRRDGDVRRGRRQAGRADRRRPIRSSRSAPEAIAALAGRGPADRHAHRRQPRAPPRRWRGGSASTR